MFSHTLAALPTYLSINLSIYRSSIDRLIDLNVEIGGLVVPKRVGGPDEMQKPRFC